MSYKHLINTHFSSCRLLATARDHCRQRDVKIFALPGEFDHVGVTDATDAWIAPAAPSIFSVDVMDLLRRIRLGEDVRAVNTLQPPVASVKVIKRVAIVRHDPVTAPITTTRSISRVQVHT